jgi:hypothetical protein
MVDGLPSDVKEFIRQHIHSLAQLEVLLTLRREPERLWTIDEVTTALYLQGQMVNDLLLDVVRRGLAEQEGGNFRYRPANDTLAGLIDRLAQLYQERRVAVTTEIFAKPVDSFRAFAEAFRLRGKD